MILSCNWFICYASITWSSEYSSPFKKLPKGHLNVDKMKTYFYSWRYVTPPPPPPPSLSFFLPHSIRPSPSRRTFHTILAIIWKKHFYNLSTTQWSLTLTPLLLLSLSLSLSSTLTLSLCHTGCRCPSHHACFHVSMATEFKACLPHLHFSLPASIHELKCIRLTNDLLSPE